MQAADTNLWVRYLTGDVPSATERVVAWLARTPQVHLPVTVILELEWVLRSLYRFDRKAINAGLRQIVGLPQVALAEPDAVRRALDLHAAGFDFADALHVALCPPGTAFVTLDRPLVHAGGKAGLAVAEP